ncbi:unnamed protein product [Diplocarpon coronariae]|nr:hypothetical protein JHW43_002702 [Diplocarpon mali]
MKKFAVWTLVAATLARGSHCPGGSAPKCDPANMERETKPWKCPAGFEARQVENGCWKCLRKIEQEEPACVNMMPDPAASGGARCCDPEAEVESWYDESKGIGGCCPKGHVFLPSSTGRGASGGCCIPGYSFDGSQCIPPKREPERPVNPPPQKPIGGEHPHTSCQCPKLPAPGTGAALCPQCQDKPFCPGVDADGIPTIGIEFGKCYVLYWPDGKQLGRSRDGGGQYNSKPHFADLPFKICSSEFNCKPGGPVRVHEPWTMKDTMQVGHHTWTDGRDAWVSKNQVHERVVDNKAHASSFSGMPSCLDGKYGICMDGFEKGLGSACPVEDKGIWSGIPNTKTCTRFIFKEINCYDTFDQYKATFNKK